MTLTEAERRTALQTERSELMLRIADWSERVQREGRATAGDYIYPPIAGCAVGFAALVTVSLYAIRNFAEKDVSPNFPQLVVGGCLALALVVAGIVLFLRRMRRAERVTETRNTYEMAVAPMQQRLREIDELLHDLDSQ